MTLYLSLWQLSRSCFRDKWDAALIEMGAKVTVVNPTKVKLIAESRRT